MNKVLIIGSGGREHTLAYKISNDKFVEEVHCIPGNGGTLELAKNYDIDIYDFDSIYRYVKEKGIDVIVVGPEGPLNEGIVDFFKDRNIEIFGPDKFASQLEGSKLFARKFMSKNNIPQPKYFECDNIEDAYKIKKDLGLPIVLKADGLASGKGVFICHSEQDFEEALSELFVNKKFGEASDKISIEECLVGEELSIFAICDGSDYKIIGDAQDHKRVFDGDKGGNTGGMGAYSPTKICTPQLLENVENNIIKPTLKGIADEGHPYLGFLYVGLMIVEERPYVIEFNVRMGDPETQVVIPRLKTSLFKLIKESIKGKLKDLPIHFSDETYITVVLASKGYPDKYKKGQKISLDKIKQNSGAGFIFHAGTIYSNSNLLVAGGRVLNVVSYGSNLRNGIKNVYAQIENIKFEGMYYRKDIGQKGL